MFLIGGGGALYFQKRMFSCDCCAMVNIPILQPRKIMEQFHERDHSALRHCKIRRNEMPLDLIGSFLNKETDERRGFLKVLAEFERQFVIAFRILADTAHHGIRVDKEFRQEAHVIQNLALIMNSGEFDQRGKIGGTVQSAPGIALERGYKRCRFLTDEHAQRMEVADG